MLRSRDLNSDGGSPQRISRFLHPPSETDNCGLKACEEEVFL
jgi:hypothetical protein